MRRAAVCAVVVAILAGACARPPAPSIRDDAFLPYVEVSTTGVATRQANGEPASAYLFARRDRATGTVSTHALIGLSYFQKLNRHYEIVRNSNTQALPMKRLEGSSGFAARFASLGPADPQGRSLRAFDLERRLFRYPCSYLIYSDEFDALPPVAKRAIYGRLADVLSGRDRSGGASRLSLADRRAIVEILQATKRDLPDDFRTALP